MTTNFRKLKEITFTLGGNDFKCQLTSWRLANNTEPGERFYTFCGPGTDGEFREEADPDWAMELAFKADWQLNAINDYLTTNDQATVAFQLDHHPNEAAWHVRWTGSVLLMAPSAGGEARTTEATEVTFPIIGKPTYTRV